MNVNMNRAQFDSHMRRQMQARELGAELLRTDLTREMLDIIMTTTVEACVDAYIADDFESGDQFASLNGVVEQRIRADFAA